MDREVNKLKELRKFYKERLEGEALIIIGMNDDRGVNPHKNVLCSLKEMLKGEQLNINTIK